LSVNILDLQFCWLYQPVPGSLLEWRNQQTLWDILWLARSCTEMWWHHHHVTD